MQISDEHTRRDRTCGTEGECRSSQVKGPVWDETPKK